MLECKKKQQSGQQQLATVRPGDAWLAQTKVHTLTYRESVYHYLVNKDSENLDLIGLTVRKSRSIRPPLRCVFSQYPGLSRVDTSTIEMTAIQTIGDRTEKLVIGAYDGEGFLIWSR
jgi:hypothetical protein